jgi:Mg/Co/Ni transporter MgtE
LIYSLAPASYVTQLFKDWDLILAMVVDTDSQLHDRITVDDIIDVLSDESDRASIVNRGWTKIPICSNPSLQVH